MCRLVCHLSALLIAVNLVAAPALAYRKPIPETAWDETTKLTLARAMVGEADWHEPDHIAIAFVLARRWHAHQENRAPLPFHRYIELYSASLRGKGERTKWIQSLTWGPLPGPFEQRWNRVMKLVQAWGDGRVKDPCPNARHWGGAMDRPSRLLHPVSCGMTRNIFYAPRLAAVGERERWVAANK
ncbi:MAG: hypothetical protein QM778_01050 [Myxococcales bacterium]